MLAGYFWEVFSDLVEKYDRTVEHFSDKHEKIYNTIKNNNGTKIQNHFSGLDFDKYNWQNVDVVGWTYTCFVFVILGLFVMILILYLIDYTDKKRKEETQLQERKDRQKIKPHRDRGGEIATLSASKIKFLGPH